MGIGLGFVVLGDGGGGDEGWGRMIEAGGAGSGVVVGVVAVATFLAIFTAVR